MSSFLFFSRLEDEIRVQINNYINCRTRYCGILVPSEDNKPVIEQRNNLKRIFTKIFNKIHIFSISLKLVKSSGHVVAVREVDSFILESNTGLTKSTSSQWVTSGTTQQKILQKTYAGTKN